MTLARTQTLLPADQQDIKIGLSAIFNLSTGMIEEHNLVLIVPSFTMKPEDLSIFPEAANTGVTEEDIAQFLENHPNILDDVKTDDPVESWKGADVRVDQCGLRPALPTPKITDVRLR